MTTATDAQSVLRKTLVVDAVASGAMGALLALADGILAGMLGLPADLLRGASLVLLPFAGMLVYLARRRRIPDAATWAVISGNVLWVVASIWLLTGWVDATPLGVVFVIAQALAVAVFAYFEYAGLRRSSGRRAQAT
jgi:hypothetical protein